jgi:hypothetical protein
MLELWVRCIPDDLRDLRGTSVSDLLACHLAYCQLCIDFYHRQNEFAEGRKIHTPWSIHKFTKTMTSAHHLCTQCSNKFELAFQSGGKLVAVHARIKAKIDSLDPLFTLGCTYPPQKFFAVRSVPWVSEMRW